MLDVMFTTRRVHTSGREQPLVHSPTRASLQPAPARRRPDLRCHGLSISHLPVGSAKSLPGAATVFL